MTARKIVPTAEWVVVTPHDAAEWLGESINDANRTIRRAKAAQYARDMAEGRWRDSNDAIVFDTTGKLLNGQHRLSAVILSDKKVKFLVIRGYDRDTQATMDSGAARMVADHLRMSMGMARSNMVAAASRQMVMIEKGVGKSMLPSHAEQLDWLVDNPDIEASVHAVALTKGTIDCNPTALVLAHFLISRDVGGEYADGYLRKLQIPAGEEVGSAIFAVLNRLRATRDQRRDARNALNLLLRGWNKWATDTKVRALPYSRSDTAVPNIAKWTRTDRPFVTEDEGDA